MNDERTPIEARLAARHTPAPDPAVRDAVRLAARTRLRARRRRWWAAALPAATVLLVVLGALPLYRQQHAAPPPPVGDADALAQIDTRLARLHAVLERSPGYGQRSEPYARRWERVRARRPYRLMQEATQLRKEISTDDPIDTRAP